MANRKNSATPVVTNECCSYGCGQLATHINLSGNLMCGKSAASCPVLKKKNSNRCKHAYDNNTRLSGKDQYDTLPIETKQRMTWNKGLTASDNTSIAETKRTKTEKRKQGLYKTVLSGVALDPTKRWKRNKFPWTDSFGNECVLESKHEKEVAEILDNEGIRWIRPGRLKLGSGHSYEPDFYLVEYDVYLDPKSLWIKNKKYSETPTAKRIIKYQEDQSKKIQSCREELSVKIIVLLSTDKRSHSWQGILSIINE